MIDRPATILTVVLLLLAGALSAQAATSEGELTPHDAPIRYVQQAPREGTPQAAMLQLVLWREEGRTEEAAALISRDCPDWLREGMLEPRGPMKKGTLSYQLREYTPEKALVSVDFNNESGTFIGWTRAVILEDGKWVVR